MVVLGYDSGNHSGVMFDQDEGRLVFHAEPSADSHNDHSGTVCGHCKGALGFCAEPPANSHAVVTEQSNSPNSIYMMDIDVDEVMLIMLGSTHEMCGRDINDMMISDQVIS